MNKWIGKLLDRVFVTFGAMVFIQLPLFMQQYRMQLIGHVAELRMQVQAMHQHAEASGKTVEALIQKFINSGDPDFSKQGFAMERVVDRFESLSNALFSLDNVTILFKPFVFFANINYDIAVSTWNSFELGIAFNLEALIYAFMGMLLGYFLFQGMTLLMTSLSNRFFVSFRRA